jgi:hypothetical protein
LLDCFTGLSLLLCVATAALWVRSYFVTDRLFRQSFKEMGDPTYWTQDAVEAGRGGAGFARIVQTLDWYGGTPYGDMVLKLQGRAPFHGVAPPQYPQLTFRPGKALVLGFGFERYVSRPPARLVAIHALVVPLWCPFLVFVSVPAVRTWRWRRRRQRLRGRLCPACGYDLRATPERCPECGDVGQASYRVAKPQATAGAARRDGGRS